MIIFLKGNFNNWEIITKYVLIILTNRPMSSTHQCSKSKTKMNNFISQRNTPGRELKTDIKSPTSAWMSPITPGFNLK